MTTLTPSFVMLLLADPAWLGLGRPEVLPAGKETRGGAAAAAVAASVCCLANFVGLHVVLRHTVCVRDSTAPDHNHHQCV